MPLGIYYHDALFYTNQVDDCHFVILQKARTKDCVDACACLILLTVTKSTVLPMGFLPDTKNCGLRMRRECRERFPLHRLQRKPLVSDPGMHQGTCVTHVPWCMSGSQTRGGGENDPGIPGVCATRNFVYLVRDLYSTPSSWYCNTFVCHAIDFTTYL